MQQFLVIGRIGADVQFYNAGKTTFARTCIADNTFYKDKETGERKQLTAWIPVIGFGPKAVFMQKHLKKGMMVALSGEWRNRVFEKDGERRYTMEVLLTQIQFCDSAVKAKQVESDADDGELLKASSTPFDEGFIMPSFINEGSEG